MPTPDTFSQALVSAVKAIARGSAADSLKGAYREVKGQIKNLFGPQSDLLDAVCRLEKKPDSAGLKIQLEEELSDIDMAQYLQDLALATNYLPWASIDLKYADPSRGQNLELIHIYTALETTALEKLDSEDAVRRYLKRQHEGRRISAQEMIDTHSRLVLLGDPGSGKSTLVNYFTHIIAKASLKDPDTWLAKLKQNGPWSHGMMLPVRIVLREFAAALPKDGPINRADLLLDHMTSTLKSAGFRSILHKILLDETATCLILLDGLDEVPTQQRKVVVGAIDAFAGKYKWHRYLVTCRIYAYIGQPYQLGAFHQATLTPFSPEQIERFIVAWYRTLHRRGQFSAADADLRTKKLKKAATRPDLIGLAQRPLLMTVMAIAAVAALCPQGLADGTCVADPAFALAVIAGESLLEIGLVGVGRESSGKNLLREVRKWLLTAMQAHGTLIASEHAVAGNVLSRLGDPRFDPRQWFLPKEDDFGFITIPAGVFRMGSDKTKDPDAGYSETPQHNVTLSAFAMARYPVTVAQYRAFAQQTGRELDEDWLACNQYDNHPVVEVSWQDAMAYCQWLTKVLNRDEPSGLITLPTEAQWEKAARGGDGLIYPWGDTVDPDRANYGDTGISATSPVGCFPNGQSPYGMLDMAGNAFEWCLDDIRKYNEDEVIDPL